MSLTGGELNKLNGSYGISAPDNSVQVNKLIKHHNPKGETELCELIEAHINAKCRCGVVSKGTIEDFGNNLYKAQMTEWGEYKYTLAECIQWEWNLFITQSLKGNLIEEKAKRILEQKLPKIKVERTEDYLDEELRIDLVIKQQQTICGVQVKPQSFQYMRNEVKSMHEISNKKWDYPVYYLFYDNGGEFINLKEIVNKINTLH